MLQVNIDQSNRMTSFTKNIDLQVKVRGLALMTYQAAAEVLSPALLLLEAEPRREEGGAIPLHGSEVVEPLLPGEHHVQILNSIMRMRL